MSAHTPDAAPSQQTTPSSKSRRRLILFAATAVVLVAVAAIAFFAFQKPSGKAGAEDLVQDYLTAVAEGRVSDARALVANVEETPGDADQQQAALDAASERISGVVVSEAIELEADVVGFGVPFTYSIAGSETSGELLVMEGEDGKLALKIDEGAGIVASPDVQMPSSSDDTIPLRPAAKVTVAGIAFGGGDDLPLYPAVYPVAVEQSYYTPIDANGDQVDSVVVGGSAEDPSVKVVVDGPALAELVEGTNAEAAAKAAADAHFPSCNVTTDTKELEEEACGDLDIFVSSPVSKGTYAWTFGSDATVGAAMTDSSVDSASEPVRATIQEDGSILQSFEATVPVSVNFTEFLPITNYTFTETKTGTSTLLIDVVTHPDGTQETFPGGMQEERQ